jgi:hypothetical protein
VVEQIEIESLAALLRQFEAVRAHLDRGHCKARLLQYDRHQHTHVVMVFDV